jgi:hypothetical protein
LGPGSVILVEIPEVDLDAIRTEPQMIVAAMVESPKTELDTRTSHGITVRLWWYPLTKTASVTVDDRATGDYFELVLDAGERAMDVFHHPYAHAAVRGVEFRAGRPKLELVVDNG